MRLGIRQARLPPCNKNGIHGISSDIWGKLGYRWSDIRSDLERNVHGNGRMESIVTSRRDVIVITPADNRTRDSRSVCQGAEGQGQGEGEGEEEEGGMIVKRCV